MYLFLPDWGFMALIYMCVYIHTCMHIYMYVGAPSITGFFHLVSNDNAIHVGDILDNIQGKIGEWKMFKNRNEYVSS